MLRPDPAVRLVVQLLTTDFAPCDPLHGAGAGTRAVPATRGNRACARVPARRSPSGPRQSTRTLRLPISPCCFALTRARIRLERKPVHASNTAAAEEPGRGSGRRRGRRRRGGRGTGGRQPRSRIRRRLRPVHLEERPDRRRWLRARHHLQPDRAQPDLRADRHRRRLPVEREHAAVDPAAGLGRVEQLGIQRRAQPRHRPRADQPGLRGGRHVHQQLGSEQRRHPALHRQGRHLAGHPAAVQAGREHARPGDGRAARGRPQPQQHHLLWSAGGERAVAQYRLRRHLVAGDQFPQRRQLRPGPQ